jgi:hypothetical protein
VPSAPAATTPAAVAPTPQFEPPEVAALATTDVAYVDGAPDGVDVPVSSDAVALGVGVAVGVGFGLGGFVGYALGDALRAVST